MPLARRFARGTSNSRRYLDEDAMQNNTSHLGSFFSVALDKC